MVAKRERYSIYDEILNSQRSLLARMAGSMQAWSFNDAGDIPTASALL